MTNRLPRTPSSFAGAALIGIAFSLWSFTVLTATPASTTESGSACSLLTPADIAKVTGLSADEGAAGAPVPGTLGKCTWTGSGNRVIVTLSDAQHMQITIAATQKSGGTEITGLGSKAVGIKAASFTGGGYIVSILDSKGGFSVSTLGSVGTRDRAIALAKIVESRR
jgi:hypothetical protein